MKKENTASFMLRFSQKIYKDNVGQSQVQWRGKISHVQGDQSASFSEFEDAITFIQSVLSSLTEKSIEDHSQEDKDNILEKSIGIWRKLAKNAPKLVLETIKDPMAQVESIQGQIKEGIKDVGDEISQRVEIDALRVATKSDVNQLTDLISKLANEVSILSKQVEALK